MATRDELYRTMQTLLAGEDLGDAVKALGDSAAGAIIQAAEDRQDAERMLVAYLEGMRLCVDANWDTVRALRVRSVPMTRC